MRAMAFNRPCQPELSWLAVLRQLEISADAQGRKKSSHVHLRRVLDVVMHQFATMETAADCQPPDNPLSKFHELTTIRIECEGRVRKKIAPHGLNMCAGGVAGQFGMGVVERGQAACVAGSPLRSGKRCSSG